MSFPGKLTLPLEETRGGVENPRKSPFPQFLRPACRCSLSRSEHHRGHPCGRDELAVQKVVERPSRGGWRVRKVGESVLPRETDLSAGRNQGRGRKPAEESLPPVSAAGACSSPTFCSGRVRFPYFLHPPCTLPLVSAPAAHPRQRTPRPRSGRDPGMQHREARGSSSSSSAARALPSTRRAVRGARATPTPSRPSARAHPPRHCCRPVRRSPRRTAHALSLIHI